MVQRLDANVIDLDLNWERSERYTKATEIEHARDINQPVAMTLHD
jgi:hypothetical protein